ncbi:MAG: hypothetical protein H8E32_18465 [Nitrospinae bacterium]|nr:hypothetical protein [Nitrospinota bacterium]
MEEDSPDPLPPYLFLTSENTQDLKAKQGPTIVRSRFVNIDFSLLSDPEKNFVAETDGEIPLILNVFPSKEFSAQIYKIEKNRSGSYSWYGKLKDVPMSQVILVVNRGRVYGNISKPNFTYQIRHIADGIHAIYEIDPSKFPPDGEPITPGAQPNPSLLPGEDKMTEIEEATPSSFSTTGKDFAPGSSRVGFGYDSEGDLFMSGNVVNSDALTTSSGSSSSPGAQSDDGSVIDLLVVYTQEARDAEGGTTAIESLIDLAASETNASYSNSGVAHVVRVVAKQEISFSETGFSFNGFLNSAQDGSISGLHDLRNTHGADLVVVLVRGDNSLCGLGFLMTTVSSAFEAFGYSVTQTNCATGNFTFGHEIGHNMAARHDRANDSTDGAPFSFNHGFVDLTNNFKTIMGTGSNTRIQHYSNPEVLFGGAVTGISEGNALAADNRLTFQNTALTVSNFRDSIDSQVVASIDRPNASRVIAPYWQSDDSSYSFVAVTHPSLSGLASQVGVVVQAVRDNGTLFGSSRTFTIDRSATRRIFIVRSGHPFINSTTLTDVELITGSSGFRHGFINISPVASNPEIHVQGFRDITMLSFWGAIVIETNTTGFAMEFIGDMHDSGATPTMDSVAGVSGVN